LPEDRQRVLRAYQRDMVNHLSAVLLDIAPDRLDRDPAKLRAATMSVFAMLNWYYMWNADAGAEAREDYAQLVANMTLHGLQGV
jgi:hypothetical protein